MKMRTWEENKECCKSIASVFFSLLQVVTAINDHVELEVVDVSNKRPNITRTGEWIILFSIWNTNWGRIFTLVFQLGDGYKMFVANNQVQRGKSANTFSYEALFIARWEPHCRYCLICLYVSVRSSGFNLRVVCLQLSSCFVLQPSGCFCLQPSGCFYLQPLVVLLCLIHVEQRVEQRFNLMRNKALNNLSLAVKRF